jgi:SAM-dependent methyltransferase
MGRIPDAEVFAFMKLAQPMHGGSLYRCRDCGLGQRQPVLGADEYAALYARLPADVWTRSELRPDQRMVVERLARLLPAGGDVLDVGCYDGQLLAALPASYRRFGIEASAAAAEVALRQGVQIVGSRIADLAALTQRFDVICAIDVIEHVHDPKAFTQLLASRLRPGGHLILSTGNLDCEGWQFCGGRYWYSSNPEHISFISKTWAERAAPELGLKLDGCQTFSYAELARDAATLQRMRGHFRSAVRKSQFKTTLAGLATGSRRGVAPRTFFGVPGLFEDHLMLTLSAAQASAAP